MLPGVWGLDWRGSGFWLHVLTSHDFSAELLPTRSSGLILSGICRSFSWKISCCGGKSPAQTNCWLFELSRLPVIGAAVHSCISLIWTHDTRLRLRQASRWLLRFISSVSCFDCCVATWLNLVFLLTCPVCILGSPAVITGIGSYLYIPHAIPWCSIILICTEKAVRLSFVLPTVNFPGFLYSEVKAGFLLHIFVKPFFLPTICALSCQWRFNVKCFVKELQAVLPLHNPALFVLYNKLWCCDDRLLCCFLHQNRLNTVSRAA